MHELRSCLIAALMALRSRGRPGRLPGMQLGDGQRVITIDSWQLPGIDYSPVSAVTLALPAKFYETKHISEEKDDTTKVGKHA